MRAGIRTRTSAIAVSLAEAVSVQRRGLYGLPGPRQTGYLCAAVGSGGVRRGCFRFPPGSEPIDGLVRTQQDPGRGPRHLSLSPALNIAAGAIFAPVKPAKPGYEIAVQEQPAGGGEAAPAAGGADREAAGERRRRARRDFGQEMRGLPHLQQGRAQPRRPESLGRRTVATAPRYRASTIRPR